MLERKVKEPKEFYFGESFIWRRKKFTRECQMLLEDEVVFACEESFIRKLEKLCKFPKKT